MAPMAFDPRIIDDLAFIRGTYLYKLREPIKTEMLLYFVLAIVAMSYFIFVTVEKMLQPAEAMAMQ